MNANPLRASVVLALAGCTILSGCGADTGGGAPPGSAAPPPVASAEFRPAANAQVALGNTRYLFVVRDHSGAELDALLHRVDDIARESLDRFDNLRIALVIHGPAVRQFAQKNYSANRELIDLAAKLDAFEVIDVKICERSLTSEGLSKADIPSFIDPVPFAPDEIARLGTEGFVSL
jgi:intracellular sulfur oxidation DsrE/DsrF family protein